MIRCVINKYELLLIFEQVVRLPKGANILCVQKQRDKMQMWARVNKGARDEDIIILMVGSGKISSVFDSRYISTVQDGELVWHFFLKG